MIPVVVVLLMTAGAVWMPSKVAKAPSTNMNAALLNRKYRRRLSSSNDTTSSTTNESEKMKILYIVTSGGKFTEGNSRFEHQVRHLILESVASLNQNPNWHVDVYLILGYKEFLSQEAFEAELRAINPDIQLRVWLDAVPMSYACENWRSSPSDPVGTGTRCANISKKADSFQEAALRVGYAQLARQHRLVVKDFLPEYDFFLAFEDDMLIQKHHVEYHMEWMVKLRAMVHAEGKARDAIRNNATTLLPTDPDAAFMRHRLHMDPGDVWKNLPLQMSEMVRLRPAFLRVEVSEKETTGFPKGNSGEVNITDVMVSEAASMIDASRCCHRPRHVTREPRFAHKPNLTANDLILWETSILGYGLRRLGDDWIGLLPGPAPGKRIPDYWTGRIRYRSTDLRPNSYHPHFLAQPAGWMASRREILEYDVMCQGGFFPPFEGHEMDGLFQHNVEYWSGGLQLWCRSCNIARFVDLQQFDRHLLYHTSNNKQRGHTGFRAVAASVLLAQLLLAQKAAELDMHHDA
jgi:hypothetical protein